MPYKPKFCCQCGEKIETVDWKPWTSRRFCELCVTEFGIYDKANWILLGIGLLFGLYGIGSYFQKPEKPLNVASSQLAASNAKSDSPTKAVAQVSNNSGVQLPTQANNTVSQPKTQVSTPNLKSKQIEPQIVEAAEKVYFCGALTKKGTMCSRRVRNGGRCWQHEGQPAMQPQEKLLVTR